MTTQGPPIEVFDLPDPKTGIVPGALRRVVDEMFRTAQEMQATGMAGEVSVTFDDEQARKLGVWQGGEIVLRFFSPASVLPSSAHQGADE